MILTSTVFSIFSGGLLSSMAINALAAAMPRPGEVYIDSFRDFISVSYKFIYDFFIGFMSLKLGHEITPIISDEKQISTIKVERTTEELKKKGD